VSGPLVVICRLSASRPRAARSLLGQAQPP
jgi:hypothetical protein